MSKLLSYKNYKIHGTLLQENHHLQDGNSNPVSSQHSATTIHTVGYYRKQKCEQIMFSRDSKC